MTEDRLLIEELAAKGGQPDFLRTIAENVLQLIGGTSRFVIWTAAVGTNGQQKPERCRKVY